MERNRKRIIWTIGVLAISASLLTLGAPAVWAGEREYDESRAAKADGVVYIENVAGSIRVEGWSQDLVHVTGVLGDEVEEVDFKVSGKKTRIEVEFPRKIKTINTGAELVIKVPEGSRVEVECVSAPITIIGVEGRIYASSISGDVEIDGGGDEVQGETISGDVEVRSDAAKISVESISGVVTAYGGTAEVEASVVSGKIVLEFDEFLECTVEAVSGLARVTGDFDDGADCEIEIHSGDIVLTVPASVKADFEVNSFNGDIDNDFGQKATRTSKYTPGQELEFSVNGGGARININTFSGDVEIRKQ